MLIFIVLGLTMIYSASSVSSVVRYGYAPYHFFVRQAIFVGVSLFVGLLACLLACLFARQFVRLFVRSFVYLLFVCVVCLLVCLFA